jgi:hypothetical protein
VSRPEALKHDPPGCLVLLRERRRALVLRGDRADLDLHLTVVGTAVYLGQLGAWHARCYSRHVGEYVPGLLDRDGHRELVDKLHDFDSSRRADAGAA